jgi:DMSO reductase family type II enzyme molybdopterin subunit
MLFTRRKILALTAVAGAGVAAATLLPLAHMRRRSAAAPAPHPGRKLGSWQDLYRERWTWDNVAKGSHGWLNCRSACAWDLYVKNGVVVREEQTATYAASEPGVPDFNPRGCNKGACYTEVMYGPSRLTVPLKRVGERGAGQWEKISWAQAIDEIAAKLVDVAVTHGTPSIVHDLGPHFDQGATSLGKIRFFAQLGATIADDFGDVGDLNMGSTMALGIPHVGGTSDEWFLSDFLVVWMMNPSVTQIADAHFLFEAKYRGAKLTVVDPFYSATAVHADTWVPLRPGTDAALALATARHLWETGRIDVEYVREQTDLPFLVRLDTGRFLRGPDVTPGAPLDLLYRWDPHGQRPKAARGSLGYGERRIHLNGEEPPLEGTFEVTLASGEHVQVATVGTLLRKHLAPWTVAHAAEVTGLAPALVHSFAEGFAASERPMILSSWGSNRFLHSDLMNRAKILCLSLKGAIGKKGAGFSSCGWFGLEGYEAGADMERAGFFGFLQTTVHLAGDVQAIALDLLASRKSLVIAAMDVAQAAAVKNFCASDVSSIDYNHQGVAAELGKTLDPLYPQPMSAYVAQSGARGYSPVSPKGPPKAWICGGNNHLRRGNQPQQMLAKLWPQLELIVDVNFKLTFTGMHCDYLLPAAGYYEKPGVKYPVAYVPYLHYCDQAVKPVGESKDEWEIFSLLAAAVEQEARRRGVGTLAGCGKRPVDLANFGARFSFGGAFGPGDAEPVTAQVLRYSTSTSGMEVAALKQSGVAKFQGTGVTALQSQLFNPTWKGEGVLQPCLHFTRDLWAWPTLTGRQQTYIDHAWFVAAGEALPTHKESPKAGGDEPFQLLSTHTRWSLHSIWRDTPLMLRLQRGEPQIYLNPADAAKLALADGDWAELSNRLGKMRMRVKIATLVRPATAFFFHAWEPYQFPEHKSYKWLTPGLIHPLHFAGGEGEGHIGWRFLRYTPGTHVQDTRVNIRKYDA